MKFNKLILFLVAICLWSINASAQKYCEVKADQLSGEKTVSHRNKYGSIRFEYKEGGPIQHLMTFTFLGEQNVSFPEGSEVIYKLEDGTILRFKAIYRVAPDTRAYANSYTASVTTLYTYTFELTKEQLEQLRRSKVIYMRWPSVDGGTAESGEKNMKKFSKIIQEGAKCLSSNM